MEFKEYLNWEKEIKPGDIVEARFTNSYSYYSFIGEITKMNKSTWVVKTLQDGKPYQNEKAGRTFIVPIANQFGNKWSMNNGIFPAPKDENITTTSTQKGKEILKSIREQTKTELKDHPQLNKKEAEVIAGQELKKQILETPHYKNHPKKKYAKKLKKDLEEKAQEVEAKRSPASQARDEKMHNKQTLPLTKENFEKWKANPDQYDLQGIDTVKKLVRAFHAAKPFRITPQPKEVSYTQEDLEKARRYLKDHNYLYKENGKYIELQAEIAKAIHAGIDPQMIDYAAHLSDDISLSESLSNEQEWELLESRGYK